MNACPGLPWIATRDGQAGATSPTPAQSASTVQNAVVFAAPLVGGYIGWKRKRLVGAVVGVAAGLLLNKVITQ